MYFALAAARYAPVHLNGITGRDTLPDFLSLLRGLPIDTGGVAVGTAPTFAWHAEQDFERWVTSSEAADPGCDPEWPGGLDEASRRAEVLFLASLHPEKQAAALDQSAARLVGLDSMTVFMAAERDAVQNVAERSDVLFLNDAELAMLTGDGRWQRAARELCGRGRLRAVVVKLGPAGAACVTAGGVVELEPHPVGDVVDPTGAGDALAGGFLGHCAREQRDDEPAFADALAAGVRCAADAIASFGVTRLRLV